MIAAKAFDPVVGVDIHIIQPPGPVPPVPVPHPFVGMLLDPMDFAPVIGATVMVNGMPRATAGTGGKCIPPHMPIGGVFVKPPANECEIFMGSSTVLADGDPLSFLGMPALSCHDVGIPPPPRLKKKRKPKSLTLPTSVVLAVPAGPPVLVGGPPTISMMALGMKAAMAGLGKAFKKLRKLQKASKKMKALSDKVHAAAKKAMAKLGVPPSVQNRVHRGICKATGHPVDVATGKVFTEAVDFELPGPIPLRWERVWYSCSVYDGPLGHGWHHSYDLALHEEDGGVGIRLADGRGCAFRALREGEQAFDRRERLTLTRTWAGYLLATATDLVYHFSATRGDPSRFLLRELHDRAGHAIKFQHDDHGILRRIVDSAGRTIEIRTDNLGRISVIQLPTPGGGPHDTFPVVTYEYGADDNLVAAYDAYRIPQRYSYAGHLLTRETDRNGVSFDFVYVRSGDEYRCSETSGPAGLYRRLLTYDTVAGESVVTDSLGGVTRHAVNELGLVTCSIDPLGHRTTFEYDEHGDLIAETNALGFTRTIEYDELGRRRRVTGFDGRGADIEWSADGRERRITDRHGAVWISHYDEAGRLVRKIEPTGIVEERTYEGGLLTQIADSAGRRLRYTYDADSNLTAVTSGSGSRIEWVHDRLGRRIEARDEAGNLLRRTYDLCGRVTRVEEPDGNVRWITYDGESNIVGVRDAVRDVRLEYVGTGRLAAIHEPGRSTRHVYDTEERLVGVQDSLRGEWTFRRDAVGNVVEERSFGGRTADYVRDALGRMTEKRWASGRSARYEFGPLGQLLGVAYADGTTRRFAYDAAGRLILAENGRCAVKYVRDARGDVIEERVGEQWLRMKRDVRGSLVEVETSQGLLVRHASLDSDIDRLTVAYRNRDWIVQTARDAMGLVRRRDCPDGIGIDIVRDSLGRPLSQSLKSNGVVKLDTRYHWLPAGQLESMVDGRSRRRFEYDRLGRLVRESRVTSSAEQVSARSADPASGDVGREGEPTRYRDELREYDADGRLIRRSNAAGEQWAYHWGDDDTLTEVTNTSGVRVAFRYDALGRRVSKATSGELRTWQWLGHAPIHETVRDCRPGADGRANTVCWLFDGLTPIGAVRMSNWLTIATDHLGTPRACMDARGDVAWTTSLDAWGLKLEESGPSDLCPFRLPGQYEDPETGLYYNRWRYYDPRTRAYTSPDPLGLRGGLDPYDYVPDPTTWIDPSGLWPEPSDTVPGNLHMVGNSTEPAGPRPGTDIDVDDAGMVKGQTYDPDNGIWPSGKSATVSPTESGLTGTFHQVPEGTKLPEGLAIVADGADVGGPHRPGHHTIYPTKDMPFEEFDAKVRSLPSEPKVKITKHKKTGEIKVTPCG